jgi:hypothetical protein
VAIETASEPATGYRWRWQVLAVVLVAEAMDMRTQRQFFAMLAKAGLQPLK